MGGCAGEQMPNSVDGGAIRFGQNSGQSEAVLLIGVTFAFSIGFAMPPPPSPEGLAMPPCT